MQVNSKPHTKNQIEEIATRNYFLLADFVVRKTGPIKNFGEFARLTGTGTNISEIRTGKRNLPLVSAVLACEVFGCSLDWMFFNRGEMFGKAALERRVMELEERIATVERKLNIKPQK
jgi:hypothetical protein